MFRCKSPALRFIGVADCFDAHGTCHYFVVDKATLAAHCLASKNKSQLVTRKRCFKSITNCPILKLITTEMKGSFHQGFDITIVEIKFMDKFLVFM
jgi:hypothetical protein